MIRFSNKFGEKFDRDFFNKVWELTKAWEEKELKDLCNRFVSLRIQPPAKDEVFDYILNGKKPIEEIKEPKPLEVKKHEYCCHYGLVIIEDEEKRKVAYRCSCHLGDRHNYLKVYAK